jgi:hypothetical protein
MNPELNEDYIVRVNLKVDVGYDRCILVSSAVKLKLLFPKVYVECFYLSKLLYL